MASSGQATKYPFNTRLVRREALWGTPRYGNRDTALKTWQSDYFFGSAAPVGANLSSNQSFGAMTGTATIAVLITVTSNQSFGAVTGTASLTVLITLTSNKSFGAMTGTGTLAVTDPAAETPPERMYIMPVSYRTHTAKLILRVRLRPLRNKIEYVHAIERQFHPLQARVYTPRRLDRYFIILHPTDS